MRARLQLLVLVACLVASVLLVPGGESGPFWP